MAEQQVKKVVIVGAVAAGMTAAVRLRRLREDIHIVVFERNSDISIASCGIPYFIGGDIQDRTKMAVATPVWAKQRYNLDVRTRHEVTGIDPTKKVVTVTNLSTNEKFEESYDKLVLSPGAKPITVGLPTDLPGVFTLRTLQDMDAVHAKVATGSVKSAVIIGCSFIGVEVAEALLAKGISVTVIELAPQILPAFDPEMVVPVQATLELAGVNFKLASKVSKMTSCAEGLELLMDQTGEIIKTDLVILSIGVTPDTAMVGAAGIKLAQNGAIIVDDHQCTSDSSIYACGDATQTLNTVLNSPMVLALAGPAVRQARVAASNIAGREDKFTGVNGTAIVKAKEMSVALTGLTEKAALRFGVQDVSKVYIIGSTTVDWYPGATPMILKVLFSSKTGKVLGCQAVGRKGVDKRIDVMSLAIQGGMTVKDIAQFEATYAPPFNGPKDVVNLAGFVGTNMMDGLVKMAYPNSLPKDCVIIDLREAPELPVQGTVPGAIHIPSSQIRNRLSEIPKDKPVILSCKVGGRGNAAYRLLVQNGFTNAFNLSGGAIVYHLFNQPALFKKLVETKVF